jgi:apolipoprotein N-acyltransferase
MLTGKPRVQIVLSVLLSVLLYGLSFPKFSLSLGGFFFLVPLLYLVQSGKVRKAFLLFWSFSFFSFLLILYWIPNVMVQYGGMSQTLGLLGIIGLAAFLSVFSGFAGSLIKRSHLFVIPFIWISKDLVVEKIFGGFPWCLTGYSQFNNTFFIQVAELGGIHLISFLLILFNVLLYRLITDKDKKYAGAAILVILVSVYTSGYFLYQMNQSKIADLPVHQAGIIQPNTNNDFMLQSKKRRILDRLFAESKELVSQGAEFIIWPEHTVSIYPMQNPGYKYQFMRFASQYKPILAGFTDRQGYQKIYNSMLLFEKTGIKKYNKVHLAPFGEYIPGRKLLFFVKRIVDEIGDFTPGAAPLNLLINGHPTATPICYEIIFPQLVRDFVAGGSELIITASNDSWFGVTSAPFQHLAMAVFRSIENRRYILRSTTNGVSGVIAPSGKIVYRSPHSKEDHFLASFKYIKYRTFFNCCGYLFPYLCVLLMIFYFMPPAALRGVAFYKKLRKNF